MKEATLRLQGRELDMAQWAVEPTEDYWDEREEEDGDPRPPVLATFNEDVLTIPADEDVIADLLYRLEIQMADMVRYQKEYEGNDPSIADGRAAARVAQKIRKATEY